VLSITSACVRRGFGEYRIAPHYLQRALIAPSSGHNGVTSMLFRWAPRVGRDPHLPAIPRSDRALENVAKLDSPETL
jgi:hypothetical protein